MHRSVGVCVVAVDVAQGGCSIMMCDIEGLDVGTSRVYGAACNITISYNGEGQLSHKTVLT